MGGNSGGERELFQLRNGRTIMDEEMSEKMFQIKTLHPESRYGNGIGVGMEGDEAESDSGFEWSDYGMADLFGELYRAEARYCPDMKSWYTYFDGAWRRDEGGVLVGEKLKDFVRLMILYCGEIVDDELRKAYSTFIVRMGDQRMRARILKDAQGVLRIEGRAFDANPYLINCQNGTYDLRDFTFREGRWDDFLTMQTAFSHTVSREVRCERWEQFIDEVCSGDKDKADYLQRALGYSLLGKANEACMFILWGKTTRNGKSTLLGTIERMLGDYSSVTPVGIICRGGGSGGGFGNGGGGSGGVESASPVLAGLKGKRFVTMSESNEYGKLDEEKIKQFTGGEEITSRALYQSAMTWLPQFTIWLSCNDLPAVRDKSLFASERVRVIEFSRHFTQEEQDKGLADYFDTQEARSGIFMWLVRGYRKYLGKGLTMNEPMKKVIRQYEKDNDFVGQFLDACCERGDWPEYRIKPKDLMARYKTWCKAEGYYPLGLVKFYNEVERHSEWTEGRKLIDGNDYFSGIRLKTINI